MHLRASFGATSNVVTSVFHYAVALFFKMYDLSEKLCRSKSKEDPQQKTLMNHDAIADDVVFQRLVRFLAKDGRTYYGDAILAPGVTDIAQATQARVIKGDIFNKHDVTDQVADIRLLLAPLAREDIETVRCLGLNYEQHAKESKMPLPKYPVLFYKPATALTGPFDNIPVPAPAQEMEGLDYECELVVIIGKEARDVPESEALEYVMGYAVGNDVSHREWQLKRGGGQWALGKGFDGNSSGSFS
ncbi:MAG: hypothetical protein Q9216_000931 [Gyalolechia sp. 2 TL-2023]